MASQELSQVDFDAIPDRQNSHSLKWTHFSKTALPYWINPYFDLKNFQVANVTCHFLDYEIALLDCASYGAPTAARLNFATPRALLREGLSRFQDGVTNLQRIR